MSSVGGIPDNWRDGKSVLECNRYMLNEQIGCDVVFLVGNPGEQRPFRAHKFMLALRSSVFNAMFYGTLPQNTDRPIEIPDVHPTAFEQMLWFIYWDFVNIDDKLMYVIAQAAEKYDLKGLLKKCKERMTVTISTDNVLETLGHYIQANLDDHLLLDACLQFIYYHTREVFGKEEFLQIQHTTLECILDNHRLNMPEEEIFEKMMEWAQAECARRNIVLPNRSVQQLRQLLTTGVVKSILYEHMSDDYFAQNVDARYPGLLTTDHAKQVSNFIRCPRTVPADPTHPRRLIFMRFRKVLTGKGYPTRNMDALSFTISKKVHLNYFLIYGSCQHPGQYNLAAKLVKGKNFSDPRVFEDNTIIKRTDGYVHLHEVPVHPVPRVIPVRVEEHLDPDTLYSLFVKFHGPPSFKGDKGRETMTHDGTTIKFMTNINGLNGTSSRLGQFPGFIFTNMED